MARKAELKPHEKEALLIMFGHMWQKRFWALDGQGGRPNLSQCIDFALKKRGASLHEDLVDFLENYLMAMFLRCQASAEKKG
jgi:hypothetical protein